MKTSRSETQSPKVAILANNRASFIKPMAEGLARMVNACGGHSAIFYDGLEAIGSVQPAAARSVSRTLRRTLGPAVAPWLGRPRFYALMRQLRQFDVVVIVGSLPWAYYRSFFWDQLVRSSLPGIPLVLYDLYYLPTRGRWAEWLQTGNPAVGIQVGGHWGLDRYDWYLLASVVSECPLSPGPHPYSLVGLNLDDGTLRPQQSNQFVALLDFEHPEDLSERAVQITALERTRTPYRVLNGAYSIEEIRRIYGRSAIFFLAMRESFGLPICEAQACGSYVFTPYAAWCPSHCKKADLSRPGLGEFLSPNFVVYDNDLDTLVDEIDRVRSSYDAEQVVRTFRQHDPQYYFGDREAVADFLERVRSGRIHAALHQQHASVPMPRADDVPWETPHPETITGRLLSPQEASQQETALSRGN